MKKKKLPKFKSEEQEARFWDTHSPLDYPDEFTEVKEPLTKKFIDTLKKSRKKRTKGIPVSRLFKKIRAKRNKIRG